jgi:superoxide dismutase, Cu-Zn family
VALLTAELWLASILRTASTRPRARGQLSNSRLSMDRKAWMLWLRGAAGCALSASGACADMAADGVQVAAPALSEDDEPGDAERSGTDLRSAAGETLGRATFLATDSGATLVTVTAHLPSELAGIHGMHVHANDVADNGEGCIADPNAPASEHFVSVDGHYNPDSESHGGHQGDLPALFVSHEGEAYLRFLTDQFAPEDLRGRALIVHASKDNYGNIPLGDADDQYTANSEAATELTAKTGNAGARVLCGVIE